MEDLLNVITLKDEEGKDFRLDFLDLIELEGEEFAVLLPLDEPDDREVFILRIDSTDDDNFDSYVSVDDDDLLERVFNIFKERFADEFDFVD